MGAAGAHEAVPRGDVPRAHVGEHLPACIEVCAVKGVRVVAVDGLYVVVSALGEDDPVDIDQSPQLPSRRHTVKRVVGAAASVVRAAEQAAVVHEALDLGVHVPPHPVEAREFGVAGVERRDGLALVVSVETGAGARVECRTDVDGQVGRVHGHAVGLVGRDSDGDVTGDDRLCHHCPLPMALKVLTKMRRSSARLAWRT